MSEPHASTPGDNGEDALFLDHTFHQYDYELCSRRLSGFYGLVARQQNMVLMARLIGGKVIDGAAGAGTLTKQLRKAGIDCTGVDLSPEQVAFAREYHGLNLLNRSIGDTGLPPGEYRTLILRECVSHLEMDDVMKEAERLEIEQILILESNLTLPLHAVRWASGHREKSERSAEDCRHLLVDAGYTVVAAGYQDALAMPLSGGLCWPCVTPHLPPVWSGLLVLDRWLTRALSAMGLAAYVCWQYWLDGRRPGHA